MADPAYPVNVTAGQWNLVAANAASGFIHRKSTTPNVYLQTYRAAGSPAPTTDDEGVKMFIDNPETEIIGATAAIDVYVWPINENGILRVDI